MNTLSAQFELPFGEKRFKLYLYIEIALSVIATCLLLAFAGAQSMWVDELYWTWNKVIYGGFTEISKQLASDGYNMPLYYWIVAPWVKVAPWGEFWLRLPSVLLTVAGFFAVKLVVKEIAGRDAGFIAFIYAVSSTYVFRDTAFGFRPYSLYLLMTALTLYFFVRRLKDENLKNIMLYGIFMALLCYSHWFGGLLAVFYALTDLVLCIAKKVKFRCIISYIITGVLVAPWLILVILNIQIDLTSYWVGSRGNIVVEAAKLSYYIMGNPIAGLILLFSGLIILCGFIYNIKKNKKGFSIIFYCTLCCVWLVGLTYCYGKFINPNGSVFVRRYFTAIIPHAFLISAVGTIIVYNFVADKLPRLKRVCPIIIILILVVNGGCNWIKELSWQMSPYEPMRQVAEILSVDADVYSEKSLVLGDLLGRAWIDYYFERRGFRVPPNITYKKNVPESELLKYDMLYVCQFHLEISEDFLNKIETDYFLIKTYYDFSVDNNGLGVYKKR